MIIAANQNGLCNRLKALLSALRKDKNAKVHWAKNKYVMRCRFGYIFKNDIETELDSKYLSGIHKNIYRRWNFLVFPEDNCKLKKIDFLYDKTPENIKKQLIDVAKILVPSDYIRDRVNSYTLNNFNDNMVTISLRTWYETKTFGHLRRFDIKQTYDLIEKIDKNKTIFLTCDNLGTIKTILKQFPNRDIIYYPKKYYHVAQNGIREAMIELCLGGLTKKLYASYQSTFSELQWWLGGGCAEVEVFNYVTGK